MSVILYINNIQVDLEPGAIIAQTKQVNDVNSLDSRQANYTNRFKLPKTAANLKALGFMSVTGNNSNVPYQKNECSLYSADTGECFVYKGWSLITDDGPDSYEIAIIDGIIDLYKAIENQSLSNLPLTDLIHTKDIATVKATWSNPLLPYRYILADYNGDTGLTNISDTNPIPQVNIDYLVPSVNVKWLWNKIFEQFNFGVMPVGAIFDTQAFKELWMTIPKGQSTSDNDIEVLNISSYQFDNPTSSSTSWTGYYFKTTETDTYNPAYIEAPPLRHIKISQPGMYRLDLQFTLDMNNTTTLYLGKNCEAYSNPNDIPESLLTYVRILNNNAHTDFRSFNLDVNQHDSYCFLLKSQGNFRFEGTENTAEITLTKVSANQIDFGGALTDFPIKDFLNEVVHRFGLTMFTKKDSNEIEFLTLQEQLQTSDVVDWSEKFSRKLTENYIYGSYAQNNWFRYAYNDKEGSYNDAPITIANVNLQDSRDVIKSKIYTPERERSLYLDRPTNIYKLWEKELSNLTTIKYKSLDKRYYFMRSELMSKSINVVSVALTDSSPASSFYIENYYGLKFNEVIAAYYTPLQNILNKAVIITAELWLKDIDIANFDFRKLYYIEQLSNYYLVNKINDYIPGRVTKCDLVRVLYSDPPEALEVVSAVKVGIDVVLTYTSITSYTGLTLQYSLDNITWSNSPATMTESPMTILAIGLIPMAVYLRLVGGGITSNSVLVTS